MKALFIEKMFELTKKPYQKLIKKNQPWEVSVSELIFHDEETLGFHLGCFLLKYDFEMQPQVEDHDVFHVLTNTGISVPEEIGMQYFLLGNGKRSLYLFISIMVGTVFYPFRIPVFYSFYKRGRQSHRLYDLDFFKMLGQPIKDIQYSLNIQ
ncbi:MAG TPA: hypothetical protein VK623_00740 [Flavobacterium sp.]|nr:hypothetical protein [Flavobacterium sp.]